MRQVLQPADIIAFNYDLLMLLQRFGLNLLLELFIYYYKLLLMKNNSIYECNYGLLLMSHAPVLRIKSKSLNIKYYMRLCV